MLTILNNISSISVFRYAKTVIKGLTMGFMVKHEFGQFINILSKTLDIHIAGSGTVYYKGNPTVKQKVAGSGDIKKLD